jgi:predicted short-subunit dehydrogenase-like oxidoreductase (DUF2520 family)
MRELTPRSIAVVGRGRLGTALAAALRSRDLDVQGPLGRDEPPGPGANGHGPAVEAILLCVPDGEIERAARAVAGLAPLVGHTSGATPLSALAPAARPGTALFGLHPLQTFSGEETDPVGRLVGAGCAIAGSTLEAKGAARGLAERLGMVAFEIADDHRAAYHASASIASNFLVTIENAAEAIAASAGLAPAEARRALGPLVRATVENWVALGPERALTGPLARGDERTVALQRAAVERTDPSLLRLFDALVDRTRELVARRDAEAPAPVAAGGES